MKERKIILCISVLSVLCVCSVLLVKLPDVIIVNTKDVVFLASWYILVFCVAAGSLVRLHEYWTQNLKLYSFLISQNEDRREETKANKSEIERTKTRTQVNLKLIDQNTNKINKILDTGGNQR